MAGSLDRSRSTDLCRYESVLREAEEELLGPLGARPAEEFISGRRSV